MNRTKLWRSMKKNSMSEGFADRKTQIRYWWIKYPSTTEITKTYFSPQPR